MCACVPYLPHPPIYIYKSFGQNIELAYLWNKTSNWNGLNCRCMEMYTCICPLTILHPGEHNFGKKLSELVYQGLVWTIHVSYIRPYMFIHSYMHIMGIFTTRVDIFSKPKYLSTVCLSVCLCRNLQLISLRPLPQSIEVGRICSVAQSWLLDTPY